MVFHFNSSYHWLSVLNMNVYRETWTLIPQMAFSITYSPICLLLYVHNTVVGVFFFPHTILLLFLLLQGSSVSWVFCCEHTCFDIGWYSIAFFCSRYSDLSFLYHLNQHSLSWKQTELWTSGFSFCCFILKHSYLSFFFVILNLQWFSLVSGRKHKKPWINKQK